MMTMMVTLMVMTTRVYMMEKMRMVMTMTTKTSENFNHQSFYPKNTNF